MVAKPTFLIVDLFCGAGGTTTGFAMAKVLGSDIAKVIACVNHDAKAIESHWLNHPDVNHYTEDIRTLDLTDLIQLVAYYRGLYPEALLILWASLECTNFSKAKGGQARDPDSRTLAHHLERYIRAINPDYVQIENVVEFKSWGPMRIKAKKLHPHYTELKFVKDKETKQMVYAWQPISKQKGEDWVKWRETLDGLGYYNEWKEMNSANYGAYTSRNRLFGCFAKHGLPIVWPETTHSKKPTPGKELWKAVKDVLDFADIGLTIFNRKKDLVVATLERIYAGLIKYVAGGQDAFVLKYNSYKDGRYYGSGIHEPMPTVAVQNRLGMCFISKYYGGKPEGKVIPVTGPAGVIRVKDGQSLVQTEDLAFIQQRNSGKPEGRVVSVDGPARTLTSTGGNQELVNLCFFTKYYGTGKNVSSIEEPAPTLRIKDTLSIHEVVWLDKTYTGPLNHQGIDQPAGAIVGNDHHNKITTSFIHRAFTNGGQHSSVDNPAGAVMPKPKMDLVQTEPFIMPTAYCNQCRSVNEPLNVITADRHYHYLINPSYHGHSHSVEVPSPVIIARQDKSPLYLIRIEYADVYIPVYDDDPPIMVKIKEFMAIYRIKNIFMRMLKVSELLKIQGFPAEYKLFGNQGDQKKFIGNSVEPHVVEHWAIAMHHGVLTYKQAA